MSLEAGVFRGVAINAKKYFETEFGLDANGALAIAFILALFGALLVWWLKEGTSVSVIADPNKLGAKLIQETIDGNLKGVEWLMSKNADANFQDKTGATALMYAVANMRNDIVKYLLAHGADASIKNASGKTAVDYAIKFQNPVAQNLINEHGL